MAWCFPCISLGQVAAKLQAAGVNYCLDFKGVVWAFVAFLVVDAILNSLNPDNAFEFSHLFLFIVLFQLRGLVRTQQKIPGSCCGDCMCALCCAPCAVTQMVGQLWVKPDEQPGCHCSEAPATLP
jgi:Cys-rich protein (TIGR01571 family)